MTTQDVIYLGTFGDADTDEGTTFVEDVSVYQQNFGSAGSPLNAQIEQATFNDLDSSGSIETDNMATTDTITTVVGTVKLDSLAVVEGTVTYSDGSSVSYTDVVMFQTDDGDLFLTNSNFAGTDISGTGSQTIQSFNVTTVTSTNYNGLWHLNLQGFACYVTGTKIATIDGLVEIDQLETGDRVLTRDHGFQPIIWVGRSEIIDVRAVCPVRIKAGALGQGMPSDDLLVSPQHRMVVRSPIIQRMIGMEEAFVAAIKLLPLEGVSLAKDMILTRYYHIMCERHEIIFANGAPSETMLPGPMLHLSMGQSAYRELCFLFPDIIQSTIAPARQILRGPQQKRAIARHIKNHKPVLGENFWPEVPL